MPYQLASLKKWIEQTEEENERKSKEQTAELEREIIRIKQSFHDMRCGNLSNEILTRFFEAHQHGLSQAREKLSAIKPTDPIMVLVKAIDDLETCLQEDFAEFIDWQSQATLDNIERAFAVAAKAIPALEMIFDNHDIDRSLQEIVLGPLKKFRESQSIEYTIGEIEFIHALCRLPDRVSRKPITENRASVHDMLIDSLLRINFNSPSLFHYCKQKIREKIAPIPTIPEEIFCLGKLKNYLAHIPDPAKLAFDNLRVPIAVMLSEWVMLLIQIKQSEMEGKYIDESEAGGKNIDARKVVTSLTIVELGLIVRLFIMSGVFRTTNKRGLAKLLSRVFSTQYKSTTENIDEMHLYASIISTKGPVLDTVQAILNRMLSKLQKIRMEMKQKKKSTKAD